MSNSAGSPVEVAPVDFIETGRDTSGRVDQAAVERSWRERGFSCGLRVGTTNPIGRRKRALSGFSPRGDRGSERHKGTEPIEGAVLAGMSGRERATGEPASRLIDERIRDLGGWRGETLARMRALILEADPEMTEEWKWMGTPVWSHHGIVCTGEAYTKVVKLTFARGARIPDPSRLFNSSLEGNTRRAIDIHEGEKVDAGAFKALVKAAVALNGPPAKKR